MKLSLDVNDENEQKFICDVVSSLRSLEKFWEVDVCIMYLIVYSI